MKYDWMAQARAATLPMRFITAWEDPNLIEEKTTAQVAAEIDAHLAKRDTKKKSKKICEMSVGTVFDALTEHRVVSAINYDDIACISNGKELLNTPWHIGNTDLREIISEPTPEVGDLVACLPCDIGAWKKGCSASNELMGKRFVIVEIDLGDSNCPDRANFKKSYNWPISHLRIIKKKGT